MSGVISGYGTYANPLSLYGQMRSQIEENATDVAGGSVATGSEAKKQSSSSLLAQSQNLSEDGSLTDQLSSLVRLTRYAMDSMGLSDDTKVTFSKLKEYCDSVQQDFSQAVHEGLSSLAVDLSSLSFSLQERGGILAHSASKTNQALAQLALDSNPELTRSLQQSLVSLGAGTGFSFVLNADGSITALGNDTAVQSTLDAKGKLGQQLSASLLAQKVDPNTDFSVQVLENGSLSVNCADGNYTDVLNAFFAENPTIASDYKRSEALSKIEDVRKYMHLSPSDMRTRLQLESLVSWWDSSGQGSNQSSFGMYSGGLFSQRSGINLNV